MGEVFVAREQLGGASSSARVTHPIGFQDDRRLTALQWKGPINAVEGIESKTHMESLARVARQAPNGHSHRSHDRTLLRFRSHGTSARLEFGRRALGTRDRQGWKHATVDEEHQAEGAEEASRDAHWETRRA